MTLTVWDVIAVVTAVLILPLALYLIMYGAAFLWLLLVGAWRSLWREKQRADLDKDINRAWGLMRSPEEVWAERDKKKAQENSTQPQKLD